MPFLTNLPNCMAFPIQQQSINGDPDLLVVINGRFIGLELKRSGERPRPLQRYKLDQISECGGLGLWASPENWEEIKQLLREISEGSICKKSECPMNNYEK